MISTWKLLFCLVQISIFVPKGNTHCAYEAISANAFIEGTDIYCVDVPEASSVGTVACEFKALHAATVGWDLDGTLAQYNTLQSHDNGDGTLSLSLFSKASYTDYIDRETTAADQTISQTFTCNATDGASIPANVYVVLLPENTQNPTFTDASGTYSYIGVPQTISVGTDITNQGYGVPITTTDNDNNFGQGNYDGAITEFEIQGSTTDWTVTAIAVSTQWPYTYRAAISATQALTQTQYEFVLIAKNADGSTDHQSTTNVVITTA